MDGITKYIIHTTIADVFHHQPTVRVDHAVGSSDPVSHKLDKGWFIRLAGSYEATYVGTTEPIMKAADRVKVTIELDDQ